MNAAFCLVAGSIGICQNPEAKSTTEEGVKVDPTKTSAVSTFPVPKTQNEVRSFLGIMMAFRISPPTESTEYSPYFLLLLMISMVYLFCSLQVYMCDLDLIL
jgi:hypothetical protein